MSKSDDDYEVGYRKPPKATRFKKGRSGNPKGRPTGARGIRASLRREMESKITVREGNSEVQVSKAEAIAKQLTNKALKGDMKAVQEVMKLDSDLQGVADTTREADEAARVAEPVDYEILRDHFCGASARGDDMDGREHDDDGS